MKWGAACGLAGKKRASCRRQKHPKISIGKRAETGISYWNTVTDLGFGSHLKETLTWPRLGEDVHVSRSWGQQQPRSPFLVGCSILYRVGLRFHRAIPGTSQSRVVLGHYSGVPPAQAHAFNTINIHWLELISSRFVAVWSASSWATHALFGQRCWWKRCCCGDHQAFAKGPSIPAVGHGHGRKHQMCQGGMPGKLEQQAENLNKNNSLSIGFYFLKAGECGCDSALPVALAPSKYQWLRWRKV